MFKARRTELLEHAIFSAINGSGPDALQAVEMWKYSGDDECNDENSRRILLNDTDISDWLAGIGDFKPPHRPKRAQLEGGIKLLFCERIRYRPPGFGISRKSFLEVEKAFSLPENTLDAGFNYQGTFFKHFEYETKDLPKGLKTISIVMKVAQKMPIANYLLALSYNTTTRVTSALIYGAFLHSPLPTMTFSLLSRPLITSPLRQRQDYHHHMPPTPTSNKFDMTQSSQIIDHLCSSFSYWDHPMLLPITVLENYQIRSNLFAWDLDDQVVALELQTGVVFTGRTVQTKEATIQPEDFPREKIRLLTKDMHSLLAEIIYFERVVEWTVDCVAFLIKTQEAITRLIPAEERAGQEIIEAMESLGANAKSHTRFQRALKERVQSQIGVLYSFIAQIDNSFNARTAVSTARDSSAMKTLALITTIFLPGTYVATLFSMSMFSWPPSNNIVDDTTKSNLSTVSPKFWIYWAVTIHSLLSLLQYGGSGGSGKKRYIRSRLTRLRLGKRNRKRGINLRQDETGMLRL
ncbi:hypothetical protein BGZ60DRAFT_522672 [Tricladium varicosporioides]|nr:hypothetical protein BGZ60DRAFT_522672 [Hymenoscyphus varicosporioides]